MIFQVRKLYSAWLKMWTTILRMVEKLKFIRNWENWSYRSSNFFLSYRLVYLSAESVYATIMSLSLVVILYRMPLARLKTIP